ELLEELPRLLEPPDRVDRGLAGVLAPRLDVEVHLAHLERPLDERVEVLLLDLPVRAQAEVVRELADRARVVVRRRLLEHFAEEAVPELARLVELLRFDRRDELDVVGVEVAAREQGIDDAVEPLRHGALLRTARRVEL